MFKPQLPVGTVTLSCFLNNGYHDLFTDAGQRQLDFLGGQMQRPFEDFYKDLCIFNTDG